MNDPSGLLNGGTFYTEPSEDISPRGGVPGNGLPDRQDQQYLGSNALGLTPAPLSVSPRVKANQNGTNADIAPWMTEGPELNTHGFNQNMFGEAPNKSPSLRPGTGRSGTTDSTDPLYRSDYRQPSLNSATTASSGNSWSKANRRDMGSNRNIAPSIGDDGRMSSKSSEVSLCSTLQRETTNSSRHSSQSTRQDTGGLHSPTGSRPRTPLEMPSSDVTPWLFQDFKVRKARLSILRSARCPVCPIMLPSIAIFVSETASYRHHNYTLTLRQCPHRLGRPDAAFRLS